MVNKDLTSLVEQLSVSSDKDKHPYEIAYNCLDMLSANYQVPEAVMDKCFRRLIPEGFYEFAEFLLVEYKKVAANNASFGLFELYIYYKLNRQKKFEEVWKSMAGSLDELLEKISVDCNERALLHVRAQFCYKIGQYEEAFKIYKYLALHNMDGEDIEVELGCNERAALGFLSPNRHQDVVTPLNEESYDLLFNESIIHSSRGDLEGAMVLLQKALELVKAEENEGDLNLIELQIAFVKQKQGLNKESRKILLNLQSRINSKSELMPIIKTNLLSFRDLSRYNENTNLPLVLRQLDVETVNSCNTGKYSHDQWKQLQANVLFLKLFANSKFRSKRTMLSCTMSQYSKLVDDVCLEPYKVQAKLLYNHMKKSIAADVSKSGNGTLLLAIQLQIKIGNFDNAIRLAESYCKKALVDDPKLSSFTRVMSYTLVELYRKTRKEQLLKKFLSNLAGLFSSETASEDFEFWKFVGFQLLALNNLQDADKLFIALSAISPNDNLVKSVVGKDSEKSIYLKNMDSLVSAVDVNNLLELGCKPFERISQGRKSTVSIVAKKKRVQKKKLPANADPNRPVDLERWLPLRDRSNYKVKKKQSAKQTQGGTMNKKSEQNLDITKQKKKGKNKKQGRR
ncbi:signal recognition particle subunit SRP72 Ecym_2192 [Eremothecium cymbalariae DBVPG|uniref:Signal recognition particle subunit SRP72 n=1 Tax=Eremothecium cymbalariae (strain CBS 270.75 / DBVPG 7215 / KCTC 17166 / NRRL Y-17582) TaxID=931890 RepID=G8JP36_ERECY|nr:Hypothetical protein Ecym_2192 [Eremothecium cymbalariae DBVPG\